MGALTCPLGEEPGVPAPTNSTTSLPESGDPAALNWESFAGSPEASQARKTGVGRVLDVAGHESNSPVQCRLPSAELVSLPSPPAC